jgi:hypothetical protein
LLNHEKLKHLLENTSSKCDVDNVVEYFEVTQPKEPRSTLLTFKNTLTSPNCEEITNYLSKKSKDKLNKSTSKLKNPYLHEDFQKLLK